MTADVLWLALAAAGGIAASLLLVQVGTLAMEAVGYLIPDTPRIEPVDASPFVVVMPAHNEVGTIEVTLAALAEQLPNMGRVLVVADNCSDGTADVARAAGARVIERNDPSRKGKGYALDHAIRFLEGERPDVIVILDADCIPEAGAINALVAHCLHHGAPVQARYELAPPDASAGTMARVGAFAWRVKNVLRPTGLRRFGVPCLLMGTGMAFPWALISRAKLASAHLVEDMALGLELAAAGHGPRFLSHVGVHSALPPSLEGQSSQRTRWETGHLQVIATLVPGLLRRAFETRSWILAALALHASVPPLALLVVLLVTTTAINGVLLAACGAVIPVAISCAAWLVAIVVFTVYWTKVGRDLLTSDDLVRLPGYILAKLGIYRRAATGRNLQWIRSKRD